MAEAADQIGGEPPGGGPGLRGRAALLKRRPWITFLLPFLVYMLVNGLEPAAPQTPDAENAEPPAARQSADEQDAGQSWLPAVPYRYTPIVYTLKIILTVAAVLFVLPGYREFPLRVSPLALVLGVVGVVVWIGLCRLGLEERVLVPLGLGRFVEQGTRGGFNPLRELAGAPVYAWGFLAIRFFGLVAVVPLIEEFFLRGLLMRFVVDAKWWEVPVGKVNAFAVLIGTLLYPLLTHPAEAFAAVAWFSMITWLMVRTRNIWDCVAAHAVTNLLMGIYVVVTGEWQLM